MMFALDARRIMAKAMLASAKGDFETTVAASAEMRDRAGTRSSRQVWVAHAANAVGGTAMSLVDPDPATLAIAVEELTCGIEAIRASKDVEARVLIGGLVGTRMAIYGMLSDQDGISGDLELLGNYWDDLRTSADLRTLLAIMPKAWTVALGSAFTAGWALLGQQRLHEARDVLAGTLVAAETSHDVKITYASRVLLASIARLGDDLVTTTHHVQRTVGLTGEVQSFATPFPQESAAMLLATAAINAAWIREREGEWSAGLEVLNRAEASFSKPLPNEELTGFLILLGYRLELVLRQASAESRMLEEEFARAKVYYGRTAGGLIAGPLTRLAYLVGDEMGAAAIVSSFVERYDWLAPPLAVASHIGLMALVTARAGQADLAVACVIRACECADLLASGSWTITERMEVLRAFSGERDACLRALAIVGDENANAHLAIRVIASWREESIRALAALASENLKAEVRNVAERVTLAIVARVTQGSLSDGALGLETADVKLLRDQLKLAVGQRYAEILLPRPPVRRSRNECWDGSRIRLTLALAKGDGAAAIVIATVETPGLPPQVRYTELRGDERAYIERARAGADPVRPVDVDPWDNDWLTYSPALARAFAIDLIDGAGANRASQALGVAVLLDDSLVGVPIEALPLPHGGPLVRSHRVEYVPFDYSADTTPRAASAAPRVLSYTHECAKEERHLLTALAEAGDIELTQVERASDIRRSLDDSEFDILHLSAHGSGRGMEYHIHDISSYGDEVGALFTHELIGSRIPPLAIVANCFSGRETTDDPFGLVPTILANGGQEVLSAMWAVPEETTPGILGHILFSLSDPGSLAEKLRKAQLHHLRMRNDRLSPYWWAGLRVFTASTRG